MATRFVGLSGRGIFVHFDLSALARALWPCVPPSCVLHSPSISKPGASYHLNAMIRRDQMARKTGLHRAALEGEGTMMRYKTLETGSQRERSPKQNIRLVSCHPKFLPCSFSGLVSRVFCLFVGQLSYWVSKAANTHRDHIGSAGNRAPHDCLSADEFFV